MIPSQLTLEDGTIFFGHSPEWQKKLSCGEVVFTTGMTGYYEAVTDPSYYGQILVFTYPLIGNYGVAPANRWESENIHVRGVVLSTASNSWSHHEGKSSFLQWLKDNNIPIIMGVDTRSLTKKIRTHGAMLGQITETSISAPFQNPNKEHLVSKVSIKQKIKYGNYEKHIILVDCGLKSNVLRSLQKFPVSITRVPYDYDFSESHFDGVVLSNGPGDPQMCPETIEILRKIIPQKKPIFGICLGCQVLALAIGASTYKLPFGHRSHNQPCIDTETKRCYISSQNHGYAINENSLPSDWRVSFRNLNDNTVEGISHKSYPLAAVQFHPEAAPGPTDTSWLFSEFYSQL